MKFVELTPTNSQKSFYGKAQIRLSDDGSKTLFSYNTPIMRICADGTIEKIWYGYSATTMKHINSFCDLYNIPIHGKKQWEEL